MPLRLLALSLGLFASSLAADDASAALEILRANCFSCHNKSVTLSGLDLSSRDAAVKGGSRGPAIVPGDPGKSRIIEAVERTSKLAMPPSKPMAPGEVATLRRWIQQGAGWNELAAANPAPASNWWAFQKVVRPSLPPIAGSWERTPVDRFILAKLRENGLKPSNPAAPAALVRRVYLNLWGLPPTVAQIQEFTADRSPDAWSKLVDRLLASPNYGEKWGRHWLDLVRYSDTAGFELDSYIHDAWRYRDWVIQSLNEDKPYDRFIREQIAGDELYPEDPVAQTGTGLFCVGPNRDLFPDQADINREEVLTDYADTTSAVFLGLTAGCARCHDHKFDPISQEDYYRIRAIFAPAVKVKVALNRLGSLGYDVAESNREWKLREIGEQIRATQARCKDKLSSEKMSALPPHAREALAAPDNERTPSQKEIATAFRPRIEVSDDEVRVCMTPDESSRLHQVEKWLVRLYSDYSSKPFSCGLADWWNVAPRTFLPAKGSRPEREVQPGFFSVLGGGVVPPPVEKREATGPIPLMPTTGRRSALAKWIADPENPLTARVLVNRVWQYHFGRGFVATPSDFGTRGGKPSHPELLDWLSAEFIAHGWSLKQLHRLILNSSVYRQEANPSREAVEKDPANLLLSHFSRRRLNADEIRDAVLQATGALNPKRGGRPVVPPLTKEEEANLTQRPDDAWVLTADDSQHSRRSIYMLQKRTFRMPMMDVFDAPESMLTCPRRESSTTAPQSLTLFNGSLTIDRSRAMAATYSQQYSTNSELTTAIWRAILAREPEASERARAERFFRDQLSAGLDRQAAASALIRGLLNVNEFLYVD